MIKECGLKKNSTFYISYSFILFWVHLIILFLVTGVWKIARLQKNAP